MGITTWLRFLVGDRRAILAIADDRRALVPAGLFVLSAGLAREYDQAYLLPEFWHALLPLGVSLATSFLLFGMLWGVLLRGLESAPPYGRLYRSFLALFWLTAPLAWLYAIPYERMLSPIDAMSANLWTLGLVSLWRVLLITRVASVLTGVPMRFTLFVVMLFADMVAVTMAVTIPKPILSVMGGIVHPPQDAMIQHTMINIVLLGVLTFPVWLVGTVIAAWKSKAEPISPADDATAQGSPPRALTALAVVSVLIGFAVLPWTQPEQQRRWRADRLMEQGRIAEGLAFMSALSATDFPPGFEPRPRYWTNKTTPRLGQVFSAMADNPPAQWVRTRYVQRFNQTSWRFYHLGRVEQFLRYLHAVPEGPNVALSVFERAQQQLPMRGGEQTQAEQLLAELTWLAQQADPLPEPRPQAPDPNP